MKFWEKYKKSFLAIILIIATTVAMLSVPGVYAEERTENNDTVDIQEEKDNAVNDDKEENKSDISNKDKKETSNSITHKQKEKSLKEKTIISKKAAATAGNTSDLPYSATVTFAGTDLKEEKETSADNKITDWGEGQSKILQVKVRRNEEIATDVNKKYILCLKVSDVLYFNGLPDATKINGVDNVKIKKNTAPIVNNSSGSQEELKNFSPYSGEIQLELNPSVNIVTVTDIGISYNKELVGYTGTSQAINNPISVSVVSVDKGVDLGKIDDTDKTNLLSYKVQEADIKTSSLRSSGRKTTLSIDGFVNSSVNEQDVKIGKNGSITYAPGAAGVVGQVYKEMKITFYCPYIEVDNQKYYLDFDENDSVLNSNKQGKRSAFKLDKSVEIDSEKHTLTYSFSNMYLNGHTPILYTPQFKWPKKLADKEISKEEKYQILGCEWEITDQKCYTGAESSYAQGLKYAPTRYGYFIPDQVDIQMTSSAEADKSEGIAKREIYKGLTRENRHTGALGFFDIHNNGALDSSSLNIQVDFNTDNAAKATYYVTQINLPIYSSDDGVTVTYTLTNGTSEKEGKKVYSKVTGYNNASSSFVCSATELQQNSGVGTDYYIKSLSYDTKLRKGTSYHAETAHLNRNRTMDGGLFFGYIEGEVGESAYAKMTISSDEEIVLTGENKKKIESTEKSTVSDDDYMAYSLNEMKIDNGKSQSITAGNTTTLQFGAIVSTEEYAKQGTNAVNGYHVFRDGIFYLCLPDQVSIAGKEQVKTNKGTVENVEKLENATCQVDGENATWWKIDVNGINAAGNSAINVEVLLSTNEQMKGLVWNFENCVVVRTKEQAISWGAAGSNNTIYNSVSEMQKSNNPSVKALTNYLNDNNEKNNLGLSIYNTNGNVKLSIARAEAMLDVNTALSTEKETGSDAVTIDDSDTNVSYDVTIASTDGGVAKNFSYYIPIVSTSSVIESGTMVGENEFGVKLMQGVKIKKISGQSTEIPFKVLYTTDSNLTYAAIRGDSVKWSEDITDYSKVTAVKIVTNPDDFIALGDSYVFQCDLKYNNENNDFDSMAGSRIQWRSFGHYTYTRNGASTESTYPSPNNSVKATYKKNYIGKEDVTAVLDTSKTGKVNIEKALSQKFKKAQLLKIKKVAVSSGTQLIAEDPSKLTGANANNQFLVTYNVNSMQDNASLLKESGASKSWSIAADTEIKLQTEIKFSTALTDVTTPRYIDITVGNEDIDITYRILMNRKVIPADASDSGIAAGEHYQVPEVDNVKTIAKDSAFSALVVVKDFVPGNNGNQEIAWKDATGDLTDFPRGTTITMMEVSDDNQAASYWYYTVKDDENQIDLKQFIRMSGTEHYTYDTTSTSQKKLSYLFVFDFKDSNIGMGTYQFDFGKTKNNGIESLLGDKNLKITITDKTPFTLESTTKDTDKLSADISYKVATTSGNDSYSEGKSLSLIITPTLSELPADARIQSGSETYYKNSQGNFIIPIGTIQDGMKNLVLQSDMFPDKEISYNFKCDLYLANSLEARAPLNGKTVASSNIILMKQKEKKPSIKISGTRVAKVSEWSKGQEMTFSTKNIPEGGSIVVNVYSGLDGNQKITDILSSVDGMFSLKNGEGIYNASNTPTGKLVLSSSAKAGTYRLLFETKNDEGETILKVPYYIIVRN